MEAFRPGTEPTEFTEGSPIIIGRGETGFPGSGPGAGLPPVQPGVEPTAQQAPPQQKDDGLGGLY